MTERTFDTSLADAQGTAVKPLAPLEFNFEAFAEYEAQLLERCRRFWSDPAGVAVYRRFRVPEVFSHGARDMERSLALQLGALQASTHFKADVPNFLEPWYGIGTIAAAWGIDYVWHAGQAPALSPPFASAEDALRHEPVPVERTPIGRRTLEMIEYFMEQTGGRLPVSLADTQSPLNIAGLVVPLNNLLLEFYTNPEGVARLLERAADLLLDFSLKQRELLGAAAVWPGHGFGSSRVFSGLGMSDDSIVMVSPGLYADFVAPQVARVGAAFGGPAFHSCGNWSGAAAAVKAIAGLVMADGAFSVETDPDPNPPEPIAEAFAGSGVALNARIVGPPAVIVETVRRLWRPGLKLLVTTYCATPAEQDEAYARTHEICGM